MNYQNLSVQELLSTLINKGHADTLIQKFGSLRSIAKASFDEFAEAGLNKAEMDHIRNVLEISRKYSAKQSKISKISDPYDSYLLLAPLMEDLDQEVVRCILLDHRERVISIPVITVGTLNSSLVHPREMFKEAIRLNAKSMIMSHQHPSGDPTPSNDDHAITKRLTKAGEILGVSVIDHIIIGADGHYFSFYESALI